MPNVHTPGPWAVEAAPNGYTYIRAKHRAEIALVGSENMLADDSSAASNALLIAAAPDLLAALQAVASQLRLYGEVKSGRAIEDIVNDAINKATGA